MITSVINHPSGCAKCAICQCRCCINKRTKCSRLRRALSQSDRPSDTNDRRCLLILIRHGTSQDEIDKRLSGWNDCDLSNIGNEQMHRAGQALRQANFPIDLCFTSVLKRASKSLFIIQEETDYLWVPVYNTWRLNDRMLGTLTGFHRDRAEALFGQNQIKEWLTRPELSPPLLEESSPLHPRLNYKYRSIASIVPSTETLIDIRKRITPFFYDQLMNNLYLGRNVLIVTHEQIIKALIRLLNNYTVDEFENQEVPIGTPIIFELAINTRELLNGYYLLSPLLEKTTDKQHQPFPTGFSSDTDKFPSRKRTVEESPLLDIGFFSSQEHTNTPLAQNSIDLVNPLIDANKIEEIVDSKAPVFFNERHSNRQVPGFRIASTHGPALHEPATLDQPYLNDGGAFSDNAKIPTVSDRKVRHPDKKEKTCCASLSSKRTLSTNNAL